MLERALEERTQMISPPVKDAANKSQTVEIRHGAEMPSEAVQRQPRQKRRLER